MGMGEVLLIDMVRLGGWTGRAKWKRGVGVTTCGARRSARGGCWIDNARARCFFRTGVASQVVAVLESKRAVARRHVLRRTVVAARRGRRAGCVLFERLEMTMAGPGDALQSHFVVEARRSPHDLDLHT